MELIESNRIELKEYIPENLELEVISFLNYKMGGIIYIGVSDKGKIVGVDEEVLDEMQLKIVNRIKNNILPSTLGLFDVEVIEETGKKLIKITISSGTEKPYYLRKKGRTPDGCYIRVGSSKEQMTLRMIDDAYFSRMKNSLKDIPSPRQDLTFNQFRIYYEEHKFHLNENFLKNLDLLMQDGRYNYNAFLVADENTVSIKVVKYLSTTKVELVENEEYGYSCIITATNKILDKIKAENRTFQKIEYYGRKHKEMIDYESIKEVIINAIVHNDYSLERTPIIELYSDRIEVTSNGGLPQELTQEEFFNGVTAPRNKEIVRIFKDLNLIESIGSGIRRILEVYDRNSFIFMEHFLRVSFKYNVNEFEYKKNIDNIKPTKIIPTEEKILEFCKEAKSLKEITSHFGYNNIDKFKDKFLKPMLNNELIKMTIPGIPNHRNQKYIVNNRE